MKPKQEQPLTLVEAEREFTKVGRVFNAYLEKTKHLKQHAILIAEFGGTGYIRTQDTDIPWEPLLLAAANLMDRDDCTPAEIKQTFDSFIEDVIMKQAASSIPPSQVHPFEQLRAVMIATIGELMPFLRRMHEFDAIVTRAGSEDELKMQLVRAFHHALFDVISDGSKKVRR